MRGRAHVDGCTIKGGGGGADDDDESCSVTFINMFQVI
jgi:hypothetical protein